MIPKSVSAIKRIMDLSMSATVLVATSPIMLVVGTLIYIESPGPVIFKQTRVGVGNREFKLYKFRTMRLDAEKFGVVYPHKHDLRVLKVGKFLRKSRLDELPNFINVILGDMSVIGPRAERPEIYDIVEREIPDVRTRLQVKPGITGLAQVRLKSDGSPEDGHPLLEKYPRDLHHGPMNIRYKLEYDKDYIESLERIWPFILSDLKITVQTPVIMFFKPNTV